MFSNCIKRLGHKKNNNKTTTNNKQTKKNQGKINKKWK